MDEQIIILSPSDWDAKVKDLGSKAQFCQTELFEEKKITSIYEPDYDAINHNGVAKRYFRQNDVNTFFEMYIGKPYA